MYCKYDRSKQRKTHLDFKNFEQNKQADNPVNAVFKRLANLYLDHNVGCPIHNERLKQHCNRLNAFVHYLSNFVAYKGRERHTVLWIIATSLLQTIRDYSYSLHRQRERPIYRFSANEEKMRKLS